MKISITGNGNPNFAGKAKAPVKCPKCGHKTEYLLSELKSDPVLKCRCGHKFKVETGGSVKRTIDELAGLDRAVNNLFKKR